MTVKARINGDLIDLFFLPCGTACTAYSHRYGKKRDLHFSGKMKALDFFKALEKVNFDY